MADVYQNFGLFYTITQRDFWYLIPAFDGSLAYELELEAVGQGEIYHDAVTLDYTLELASADARLEFIHQAEVFNYILTTHAVIRNELTMRADLAYALTLSGRVEVIWGGATENILAYVTSVEGQYAWLVDAERDYLYKLFMDGNERLLTKFHSPFITSLGKNFLLRSNIGAYAIISVGQTIEVLDFNFELLYDYTTFYSVQIDTALLEYDLTLALAASLEFSFDAYTLDYATSILADAHVEYSINWGALPLIYHPELLGSVEIMNRPTTGDLRKTDLITLKHNFDVVNLRSL